MHLARASLSPSDMSPSRAAVRADRGDVSEGDAWVDTDLDSSDAASEGGEPEFGTMMGFKRVNRETTQ